MINKGGLNEYLKVREQQERVKMNITIGGVQREVTDEQFEQIEKLLNKELRTPDKIIFLSDIDGDTVNGIFFNKDRQVLGFSKHTGQWIVFGKMGDTRYWDRRLVPIKREDLKPGDIAFRSAEDEEEFDRIADYCIILDDEKVVSAQASGYTPIRIESGDEDETWWKVV